MLQTFSRKLKALW